jgi:hypothetical protein
MSKIPLPRIKWSIKKVAVLIVVVVLAVLVLYFIHLGSSPNEGKIKINTVESADGSPIQYATLNTSYFSLLYPDKYTVVQDQPSVDYLVSYKSSTNSEQSLEITLKNAPDGGIVPSKEYQAYSKSSLYKMSNKFYGSETVDLAFNGKGKEEAALWLHGKYLLAIKMKDDLSEAGLKKQMNDMLASVVWR